MSDHSSADKINKHRYAKQNPAALIRYSVFALLCVVYFSLTSACRFIPGQVFTLEDAVLAGVIIDWEYIPVQEQPDEYTLTSPVIQELVDKRVLQANLFYPVEKDLFFVNVEGEVSIFVEEGQHVSRGDLLATLSFDVDERHYIDYNAAVAHLTRLEQEFNRERTRQRNEISKAREEEQPEEIVRLLEIDLQRNNFINSLTVAELEKEISNLGKLLGTEEITAPYDGMVFYVFEGNSIKLDTDDRRMMRIVDPDEFFFRISISTTHTLETHYNIMGHGDIVTVRERTVSDEDEEGTSHTGIEFEARVVTDSWTAGQRENVTYLLKPTDPNGLTDRLLALDSDDPIITLRSLRWSVTLEYAATPKGITLPAATIHREHIYDDRNQIIDELHYVFIYLNGNVEKRSITMGKIIDGYVQVITGLDEGAKVVILR